MKLDTEDSRTRPRRNAASAPRAPHPKAGPAKPRRSRPLMLALVLVATAGFLLGVLIPIHG